MQPTASPPPHGLRTGRLSVASATHRRPRVAAVCVPLLLSVVALAGCSNDAPDETPQPADSSTSNSPARDAPPKLDATAMKIDELVGEVNLRPTTETLPAAPPGFNDAEVAAFADRAIDIVTRGVAAGLTRKSPSAAYNYVFANQYRASRESSRQATQDSAGRYDWEWAWASRFDTEPAVPARFLTSRWQVETETIQLNDGTPDELLRVILSVSIEHLVPHTSTGGDKDDADSTGDDLVVHPIVMQRKVIVQGLNPLGGPKWWPGIGVQASPLFGGGCAPVNGSILTPATRPKTLNRDLERLADYIDHPKKVDTDSISDDGDLAAFVAQTCED